LTGQDHQLGACTATLAWMGIEWWHRRKPSGTGIAAGGAAAGLLCYGAVHLKDVFHYDDSLDVVGVHMVGGAIGVLLTGVFASLAVNAAGEAGGWLGRLAVVGIAYPFVMTWIILWVTDRTVGLQVSPGDEQAGLDLSEHAEVAYRQAAAAAGMTSDGMVAAPGAPRATEAQ
jgi:Amt family ammonium transporter